MSFESIAMHTNINNDAESRRNLLLRKLEEVQNDTYLFSDEISVATVDSDCFNDDLMHGLGGPDLVPSIKTIETLSFHPNISKDDAVDSISNPSLTSLLASGSGLKRSFPFSEGTTSLVDIAMSTMMKKDSMKKHQKQKEKQQQEKPKLRNVLHSSCRLMSKNKEAVNAALAVDPEAIRKRQSSSLNGSVPTPANKKRRISTAISTTCTKNASCQQQEPSYPINIALGNQASLDVVRLLVEAGPDVLEMADGVSSCGSLSIALRHSPRNLELIDLLLITNPRCVQTMDRHNNYPLHIACQKGASLDVIRHVHMLYPEALQKTNFRYETPLQIAQKNCLCSDDVLNFLEEEFNNEMEKQCNF